MTRAAPHPLRGLFLVCAAGVLWGTIGPAVALAHEASGLSPWTIGAWRSVVAVAALVPAVLLTRRLVACRALWRDQGHRLAVVSLLVAGFQFLFFVAVLAVGVGVGTVVCLGFAPVLLLVTDSVRERRPPSTTDVLTVATAVLGLVLVSSSGDMVTGPHPGWGVLAALASGTCYAFATDLSPALSARHDPLVITTLTMVLVTAVLVPAGLALALVRQEPLVTADPGTWALVVHLGVITMGVAYVLLYAGLRTTTGGAAVIATLLEPVTAVVLAVLLLGERLTLPGVVGALLILAAITRLGLPDKAAPQ